MPEEILRHIRVLSAELPPRGATSEGERQAAEYVTAEARQWAQTVVAEPFRSCPTLSWPYGLVVALLLLAGVLVWTGSRVAPLPAAVAFFAYFALSAGRFEVGRLCPQGPSQNVVAKLAPGGQVRRRVVLVAHLDVSRWSLFYAPGALKRFRFNQVLNTVSVSAILLAGIGSALWPGGLPWAWLVTPFLLVVLYGGIVLLHREVVGTFIPGANDNASGVAVALEVGRYFSSHPLAATELWCVFTGCEEVGFAAGMDRFLRRHRDELSDDTAFIVLDNVGAGQLRFLTGEGIFSVLPSDPHLVALAGEVGSQHPRWQASPFQFRIGYTDATPAVLRGLKTITLLATAPDGLPLHYHWPSDTVDHLDGHTLESAFHFTRLMVESLDRQAAR